MRVLTILLLLFAALDARENPFAAGAPQTAESAKPTVPDMAAGAAEERSTAGAVEESPTGGESENIDFGAIRFFISGGEVQIETKDRLKQHFAIKNPTRIILNFASDTGFPTRRQAMHLSPFHEIRVGAHKGYYSVVIELDSPARYKMTPTETGYTLMLY